MDFASLDLLQLSMGFLPGLILGFIIFKLTAPKAKKSIASSADDASKLQNEVLQDEVKHLQDKIITLEKALDMKLK
jgi:uncharacterized membrane-anchored protein YhcB (DUF1043 family)